MKYIAPLFSMIFLFCITGCSQTNNHDKETSLIKVGGGCEGCEVIYESPVPLEKLSWIDTLPDFIEPGPKLIVSGIVFQPDGKTPAKDIVIYIYHTDQNGQYTNSNKQKGFAGRHGYIKGWVKTNEKGEYKFCTLKPAPYPGATIPAHIHPVIKEPTLNEYYIDEYLFDDDLFLTLKERARKEHRGGSGIVKTELHEGILHCNRNIILGKNIPNYPDTRHTTETN